MLVCAIPARAAHHRPRDCGKLAPRAELSCARRQLAQARRHPLPHSRGYWRWRERVARRWLVAARYRIAHPPIAHEQLWVCIHNFEGAWNDDTGNAHFGGLQMTENWGPYGRPLVWHANLLSPYGQMRVAEDGYRIVARAQGWPYARSVWIPQQWWHPECFKYA